MHCEPCGEQERLSIDTCVFFCTDCEFTAEPTEPNLSWHYLNAVWDALKTLDDKIIVYTCNCHGGPALMLLTDGNSNRAFLCADLHGELEIQQGESQVRILILQ